MPRGGARPGSGPKPDPNSGRSERRRKSGEQLGQRFGRLPRGGYTGRLPAWPLTTKASARENEVWKKAWRTPQAAAWATEPWRHRTVALWCRWTVRMEDEDANAAVVTATTRLADQIGLTPSGMRMNGWEIEEAPSSRNLEEPAAKSSPAKEQKPSAPTLSPRERLTVVRDGAG